MTSITYETVLQWADHEAGPLCMDKDYQAAKKLLEAAPDLLEALQLADAMLSGANMDAKVVEKKVRSAIAKATGEQP